MTVNLSEITQLSLQLAHQCFLECEVGPQKAICWEVVVGYFSGKEGVIPPEGGTLAPDGPLLYKTGTALCLYM